MAAVAAALVLAARLLLDSLPEDLDVADSRECANNSMSRLSGKRRGYNTDEHNGANDKDAPEEVDETAFGAICCCIVNEDM